MKKISTLTLLVVAAFLVSAQSYRPFPDSGYFWNEEHGTLQGAACNGGLTFEYHNCLSSIYFGLDTTINAVVYHRLYNQQACSWQAIMSPGPPCLSSGNYIIAENLVACFRQDTSLRQVFIYDFWSSSDMLLYDFSLSAGDTLLQAYNNPNYPDVQVTRIDSILLADGYHKQFILNLPLLSGDSISIIEGVGSSIGLLEELHTQFENNDVLLCLANAVQTIYPDTGTSCNIVSGIPAVEVRPLVELFPNPFQDYLYVSFAYSMKNVSIRIYQADGRLILNKKMDPDDSRIYLPGLSGGIYFVVFDADQGSTIQKLIRLEQ